MKIQILIQDHSQNHVFSDQKFNQIFINSVIILIISMEEQARKYMDGPPQNPNNPANHPERITQMQCLQSNSQLKMFFIQGINQSFKYLPNVLSKIYNQIQFLINFLEYRVTISVGQPHPGDFLQNIRYAKKGFTQSKKIMYLLLTVILPYLKTRSHGYLVNHDSEQGWKNMVLRAFNILDRVLSLLNFINLSIFIVRGKYRTFVQRILKIPMEFIDGERSRVLNFSLMNRKIIWGIYELFLKTLMPYASGFFGNALKNVFYLNSYMEVEEDNSPTCIICHNSPIMPMKPQSCSHIACYYCVSSQNRGEQDQQKCNICGQLISEWKKMF